MICFGEVKKLQGRSNSRQRNMTQECQNAACGHVDLVDFKMITLLETNISPENGWLEDDPFL